MDENLIKDEYATKDLYFAAFLYLKGMNIVKLEQYGNNRGKNPVYFIFNDKSQCEELENVFWNGIGDEIVGNIKVYIDTIKDLKARMFSISRAVSQRQASY